MQPFLSWLTAKPLPEDLNQVRTLKPIHHILVSTGLIVFGVWLAGTSYLHESIALWLLGFLLATGGIKQMQVMICHNCAHDMVFEQRETNLIVGRIISGALMLKPFDTYKQEHALHHSSKTLLTDDDDTLSYLQGVVGQPRMGFSDPARMQAGLEATAACRANTVCTITLNAFTRVNNLDAAQRAIDSASMLNGYPIVNHPAEQTRAMLDQIHARYFLPVQIRHGSPDPLHIFKRMVEIGAGTTEGGPLSYCLPYNRMPLREAFGHWEKACQVLSSGVEHSHIESFAGCMMGQMCDPVILVALNILEGLFLRSHGIQALSFSYAQGTSPIQDRAAVAALQQLASEYFAPGSYHFVGYVFMGFFPRTLGGFCRITGDALGMVRATGVHRVIIKTPVESRRIPRVEENIAALEYAAYCLHPDNKRGAGTVLTAQNYYHGFEGERVENAFSFLAALRQNIRTYDGVL